MLILVEGFPPSILCEKKRERKDGSRLSRFAYCDQRGTWASAASSSHCNEPRLCIHAVTPSRSGVWIIIEIKIFYREKSPRLHRILTCLLASSSCFPNEQCIYGAARRGASRLKAVRGSRAKLVIITLNYRYIRMGDTQLLMCMHACARALIIYSMARS